MAFTTQAYHEHYDTSGQLCRIDIKRDTTASLDPELNAAPSPIRFIRPAKDTFAVVRGSGCEITFLSRSDMIFSVFFGEPLMRYRIEYRVASTLVWFGYLNTEVWRETYSENIDYPVTLTGNNGFSLLDRIKYLDGSGDPYTGLSTEWDVIEIVLGKWGLMDLVNRIKVGLGTTSTETTIGFGETILHNVYVDQDNYYDEDGEPKTCRQVLEDILGPYGAFIQMRGIDILIADIDSVAGSIEFKNYSNAFVYANQTLEAAGAIDDIELDAGYYETGSVLDGVGAVNRQVVKFSPYAHGNIKESIQNVEDMTFSSGSAPSYSGIGSGSSERADNISGLLGWTFYNVGNTDRLVASRNDSSSDGEFYIRIINPNDGATPPLDTTHINLSHSDVEFDIPYIVGIDKFYIKITGLIRALDDVDPYENPMWAIYHVGLHARLWIGAKSFDPVTHAWNTSQNEFIIMGGNYDGDNMGKWLKFKTTQSAGGSILGTSEYPMTEREEFDNEGIYIGLPAGVHGKLKLNFSEFVSAWTTAPPTAGWDDWNDIQTTRIKTCEVKDIKIELIKRPEMTAANIEDIEYISEFDTDFLTEGKTIVLNHGTSDPVGSPFDKGGLIYFDTPDYFYFTEWTRGGATDTIENLLLNSVQANQEGGRIKITARINNTSGIQSLRFIDATHMSGKIFMVTGSTLDPGEGFEEIEMIEVVEDSELGSVVTASRSVPKKYRNGRVYWEST